MKTTAFALALMLGGAAVAQTPTTNTDHSAHTMSDSTTTSATVAADGQSATATMAADAPNMDSSAAAQTGTAQTNTSWGTTNATTTSTTSTTSQTAAGDTAAASTAWASAGQTVQPGNTAPERDARGIRVISAPAMAPAGWNGTAGSAVGGPLLDASTGAAAGADAGYPACSAAVTDNCVQTYERGRSR